MQAGGRCALPRQKLPAGGREFGRICPADGPAGPAVPAREPRISRHFADPRPDHDETPLLPSERTSCTAHASVGGRMRIVGRVPGVGV